MKLLVAPMKTTEIIGFAGDRTVGRTNISRCTILVPSQKTDKQRVWNKLQYDNYVPLELGRKTERIDFPDSGYILYGVIPVEQMIEPESTEYDGEIFICTVDNYAYKIKE